MGPRRSAVEVLAHHAIEVKNVVRAKGATWGLKAWFDLSSDDSAGGVEGGGGGQRIALRRPHPRANRLAFVVARLANQHSLSGSPICLAWSLPQPVNLGLEEALYRVQPEERLDEPRLTRKRPDRWRRFEMDVDIGNAGRMERSCDDAPTDLEGRLLTLSEIA